MGALAVGSIASARHPVRRKADWPRHRQRIVAVRGSLRVYREENARSVRNPRRRARSCPRFDSRLRGWVEMTWTRPARRTSLATRPAHGSRGKSRVALPPPMGRYGHAMCCIQLSRACQNRKPRKQNATTARGVTMALRVPAIRCTFGFSPTSPRCATAISFRRIGGGAGANPRPCVRKGRSRLNARSQSDPSR